jgi:hypothetical protein
LLFDANDNSCPDDHSCPDYNAMPHYDPMPYNRACPYDCTRHLQELLLPCWVHGEIKALQDCMQFIIWMLCSYLLPDHHNNSSSSHHHPLSNNYARPHDHTADMCIACLPEADGHQAKSWKDFVQGLHRKNLQ